MIDLIGIAAPNYYYSSSNNSASNLEKWTEFDDQVTRDLIPELSELRREKRPPDSGITSTLLWTHIFFLDRFSFFQMFLPHFSGNC